MMCKISNHMSGYCHKQIRFCGVCLFASFIWLANSGGFALAWQEEDTATTENQASEETRQLELSAPLDVPAVPLSTSQTDSDETNSQADSDELQSASFQEVTPGISSIEDVKAALGEPEQANEDNGLQLLVYQVEPFSKIEVVLAEGLVDSMVIYLDEEKSPVQLAQDLGLEDYKPAIISDQDGQPLGEIYPERGVMFSFAEISDSPKVAQIIIQTISAEPFMLRVEQAAEHDYQANLDDLDRVILLEPKNARAFYFKAEILTALGQYPKALKAAKKAQQLGKKGQNLDLLEARLLGLTGKFGQAQQAAEEIVSSSKSDPLAKSQAELLIGDLLALGPKSDLQQAIEHHMNAIRLAKEPAGNKDPQLRHQAQKVLLDAHLAVAGDIAWGNWSNKSETTLRWLSRAAELAELMIDREGADPALLLLVNRKTISAFSGMDVETDPSATIDSIIETTKSLISKANDPLRKRLLEWELGESLFEAMRIEQIRGEYSQALKYGDNASVLLEANVDDRDLTPQQTFLIGQLHFYIGSIHAVGKEDHKEAISWYTKAMSEFEETASQGVFIDATRHGERYVSMGVSFWNEGQQKQGLELTSRGVLFLQQAVKDGAAPQNLLAIPYGNLAAMHGHFGNTDEAKTFAALSARLQSDDDAKKR